MNTARNSGQLRQTLLAMPRRSKQISMILSDAIGIPICSLVAHWVVSGSDISPQSAATLAGLTLVLSIGTIWALGFYYSIIRYMGLDLLTKGVKATLVIGITAAVVSNMAGIEPNAGRFGTVFAALVLVYIVGGRLLARMYLNRRNTSREGVIVYGAGDAGAQLIASLFGADDYLPVAIVDDDPLIQGKHVHGLRVYSPDRLPDLLSKTRATGVLLAVPTASRRRRRAILEKLSKSPVHVQTMPQVKDIVSGKARVDEIREVDVEDLLGRDSVPPHDELLEACIKGKSVMVTGAGGSIGSELCMQIMRLKPKRLVCFEVSEPALYDVDRTLKKKIAKFGIDCEVVALLGSVDNFERVRDTMDAFEIQTVYHAAAYKHVPIVEQNVIEGVNNNVIGTLHTARAAAESRVETFVLISTDKAVNPTNVMGATKRLSELVLQAFDQKYPQTRFCMVRFGNVLESSGSVVPLFREQIRSGGPVTVTHRDIIRYFMTIPEAAQLVIQAGSMAEGGDVFVLDMGEPVRIEDLANRMINLMGLTVRNEESPDGDIAIEFIGLRPAEKLYEELLIGSNVSGTNHPRIMRANESCLDLPVLNAIIDKLKRALAELDCEQARALLLESVQEYTPSNGIDDLVWSQRTGTDSNNVDPNVVEFPHKNR